jgi:hypothetical protein
MMNIAGVEATRRLPASGRVEPLTHTRPGRGGPTVRKTLPKEK